MDVSTSLFWALLGSFFWPNSLWQLCSYQWFCYARLQSAIFLSVFHRWDFFLTFTFAIYSTLWFWSFLSFFSLLRVRRFPSLFRYNHSNSCPILFNILLLAPVCYIYINTLPALPTLVQHARAHIPLIHSCWHSSVKFVPKTEVQYPHLFNTLVPPFFVTSCQHSFGTSVPKLNLEYPCYAPSYHGSRQLLCKNDSKKDLQPSMHPRNLLNGGFAVDSEW